MGSRSKSCRKLSYSEFRNRFSVTFIIVVLWTLLQLGFLAPNSISGDISRNSPFFVLAKVVYAEVRS
jgi:hypothetical protein